MTYSLCPLLKYLNQLNWCWSTSNESKCCFVNNLTFFEMMNSVISYYFLYSFTGNSCQTHRSVIPGHCLSPFLKCALSLVGFQSSGTFLLFMDSLNVIVRSTTSSSLNSLISNGCTPSSPGDQHVFKFFNNIRYSSGFTSISTHSTLVSFCLQMAYLLVSL